MSETTTVDQELVDIKSQVHLLAARMRSEYAWCTEGVNHVLAQVGVPQLGDPYQHALPGDDIVPDTLAEWLPFFRKRLVRSIVEVVDGFDSYLTSDRFNEAMRALGMPELGVTRRVDNPNQDPTDVCAHRSCNVCYMTEETSSPAPE